MGFGRGVLPTRAWNSVCKSRASCRFDMVMTVGDGILKSKDKNESGFVDDGNLAAEGGTDKAPKQGTTHTHTRARTKALVVSYGECERVLCSPHSLTRPADPPHRGKMGRQAVEPVSRWSVPRLHGPQRAGHGESRERWGPGGRMTHKVWLVRQLSQGAAALLPAFLSQLVHEGAQHEALAPPRAPTLTIALLQQAADARSGLVGLESSHNTGGPRCPCTWMVPVDFSRIDRAFFPPSHLDLGLTASFSLVHRIRDGARLWLPQGSFANMSAMRKHNVTTFPQRPVVERTNRHIQIKWHGSLIADCPPGEAYWMIQTHHAPSSSRPSSSPFPLSPFPFTVPFHPRPAWPYTPRRHRDENLARHECMYGRRVADSGFFSFFFFFARAVYFIPPSRVKLPLSTTPRTNYTELLGNATYYAIMSPISATEIISNRIWSYNEPSKEYEAIQGYLAFFVGPWECYVDNERAHPPPADFYGGWVTSDIEGLVKGHPQWGTAWDPVF